ncbi:MAG TPA: hypothetical protein VEK79_10395 [Thermoanaerobaculia bacterium]|nr:hypothetical protein [Thermoanaerobaculia bacterium]
MTAVVFDLVMLVFEMLAHLLMAVLRLIWRLMPRGRAGYSPPRLKAAARAAALHSHSSTFVVL